MRVNAVFQFDVKNADGKVQTWTLNFKNPASEPVTLGKPDKADIVIAVGDADFVDLASGKLNGTPFNDDASDPQAKRRLWAERSKSRATWCANDDW